MASSNPTTGNVRRGGRPVLVGRTEPYLDENYRDRKHPSVALQCERCAKHNVWVSRYQAAKKAELDKAVPPAPIVDGGAPRPFLGVFCWWCANDLGIRQYGQPIDSINV